jgi:hypothetical protein
MNLGRPLTEWEIVEEPREAPVQEPTEEPLEVEEPVHERED